ncbi:hypothetical protein OSB04_025716 [Centaurea solstitialis]|uniref:Peroxidase n=1 Tax=Centaurea solstitialis TaxID=347529 RepID=A0AA38SQ77_9ASTR|nr:hypothetical protein OSB04_025716 [Centaurea solstitialis]
MSPCREAKSIILNTVRKVLINDHHVAAGILRLRFHDCIITVSSIFEFSIGCDVSVLLNSSGQALSEKDGSPNVSLRSFYVIHNANKWMQSICPSTVSCTDILTFTVRDVVFLVSAHTLGFAHCSCFQGRIHWFSATEEIDPTMKQSFAAKLRQIFSLHNSDRSAAVGIDPTSTLVDNRYFKEPLRGKDVLKSNEALLSDDVARGLPFESIPPNVSLRSFYVMHNAKRRLESLCPSTVSCADILAFAARDAVYLSGGPEWNVAGGRQDGLVSRISDTNHLPPPTFNLSQLRAHTLGFAHCSSFKGKIRRFSATEEIDPAMNQSFAAKLRQICPLHNTDRSAGVGLDPTPNVFDNRFFKELQRGRGVLASDKALLATT